MKKTKNTTAVQKQNAQKQPETISLKHHRRVVAGYKSQLTRRAKRQALVPMHVESGFGGRSLTVSGYNAAYSRMKNERDRLVQGIKNNSR